MAINFQAPEYQLKNLNETGQGGVIFDIPGAFPKQVVGQPILPVFSVLVGIPPQADYSLHIRSQQTDLIPQALTVAIARPETRIDPETGEVLTAHPLLEGTDLVKPESGGSGVVRIASEAWVRDQRVLRLEYSPIIYNPETQRASWTPDVIVELTFEGKFGNSHQAVRPASLAGQVKADPFEKILQSSLLNYVQASAWRASPQADIPSNYGFTQGRNFAPQLKLVVDHDGLYRVTADQIAAAGLDLTGDPANLQLISQGQPVAYMLEGDGDAAFESGEALLFYGQYFRGDYLASVYSGSMKQWSTLCPLTCKLAPQLEDYTNENVYWLSMGSAPGLKMAVLDGAPQDTAVVPQSYPYTQRAEENHRWIPTHLRDNEVWFWAQTSTTTTTTFKTNLSAIAPAFPTVVVSGTMMASTNVSGHTAKVYLNNSMTPIASGAWNYIQRYNFRSSVPVTMTVNNGENSLKLRTNHIVYFSWFEVAYQRQFVAMNNSLEFRYPLTGTFQYQSKGFSSSTAVVLDITNPLQPVQYLNPRTSPDGGAGTYQVEFQTTQSQPGRYYLTGGTNLQAPKQIAVYNPPDLTPAANGADYIFITHQKFISATNTLANFRQSQGLSTIVVNVDDVYDQFNYGIYHSVAIRNYLAFAMSSWQIKPQYVLLVGDGHLNFRNNVYNGTNAALKFVNRDTIYMPPNMAFIDPWQGQTDSTPLLAMVVGTDPLADLYIGRLPVNSTAQADAMVAKTIGYEQSPHQSWQKNMLYITDNTDSAGNFLQSANELSAQFTPKGFITTTISLQKGLTGTTARAAISRTVTITGSLFLTYIGHASIPSWAAEQMMNTKAVTTTMHNQTKLPVVLSLDCLDGFWHYPDPVSNSSLVETMVRIPGGGAVAAFSPTGLGLASGHDVLAQGFYSTFFTQEIWELAPAAANARLAIYATGYHSDLLYTYSILGDPALQVQGFIEHNIFVPIVAR